MTTDEPEIPDVLIYPTSFTVDAFNEAMHRGIEALAAGRVAITGLARDCAGPMRKNLSRLKHLTGACGWWRMHVETNDNTDGTVQTLEAFCRAHPEASYRNTLTGRPRRGTEFAGPRTQAMAEYRAACQTWVANHAADSDYVIIIDLDAWGGWSHAGLLHGIGVLASDADCFAVASVSLFQHPNVKMRGDTLSKELSWLHYDCWALRLNSYWDDYTAGMGIWKTGFLPLVGSAPIKVCSAFGGMAAYKTKDYLAGTYGGSDCEHVVFHKSVAEATGKHMYLDPSMRTVMSWWTGATDGWQHSDNLGAGVQG